MSTSPCPAIVVAVCEDFKSPPHSPMLYLHVMTLKSVDIYFSCKGSDFLSRPILLCTYCLWRVEQFCLVVRDIVGRSTGARSKTILAATSF
jgi:hypothetical protein